MKLKTLLVIFFVLLVLGLAVQANAQEILKGKVPVTQAVCFVDKDFVMKKGNPFPVPCVLFVGEDEDVGYVLLINPANGKPLAVVELKDGNQKVVWRYDWGSS